jgi:hypothetical protein
MPANKTKPETQSVAQYIDALPDDRRKEVKKVVAMMKRVTGEKPTLWTGGMIGFGRYRYKYNSGHGGEWFLTGLAARNQNLTLYIISGFEPHAALLKKLGEHKTGKSCLYLKNLDDVDMDVLEQIVANGVKLVRSGKLFSDRCEPV